MTTRAVRVAIVDDHPMFLMGLAAAIHEMDGIELVGDAQRVDQVADLVARSSPDVVLLDVRLPDGSGLDVNRWLAAEHPEVRTVLLTMSEDPDTAIVALRDGARGYVVKGAGPERVEHAVRAVATGMVVLDESIVSALIDLAASRARPHARAFPQLTDREFEVLGLIAEGLDNTSIARRLVVNPKTVRNHVSNVIAKMQVADRSAVIVEARRHGLGT